MSLQKQLILIFGALAFISLVVVGITFWTFGQWRWSGQELRDHYQRNLLLEQIRVTMFKAIKEVPDAVTGDDPESGEEFVTYIKPAEDYFKAWKKLAKTPQEKQELKNVEIAFDSLVHAAQYAFSLVEAGRKTEAFNFMESNLEDKNFMRFQKVTEQVAAAELRRSNTLRETIQAAQQHAQIVLIIAAFGAIALILLLLAYISTDLFKPLKEMETALEQAANGNLEHKLDEDRKDEIGTINKAFNHLMHEIKLKENFLGHRKSQTEERASAQFSPIKLNLHYQVAQMQELVQKMNSAVPEGQKKEQGQELLTEITRIADTIKHGINFHFPLKLNPEKTDIRQLLHESLSHFLPQVSNQNLSLEVTFDPAYYQVFVDRYKLREGISILIKNALNLLPENGGKLALRTRYTPEEPTLVIEIGAGLLIATPENNIPESLAQPSTINPEDLALVNSIIDLHCGEFFTFSDPVHGYYARIALSLIPVAE